MDPETNRIVQALQGPGSNGQVFTNRFAPQPNMDLPPTPPIDRFAPQVDTPTQRPSDFTDRFAPQPDPNMFQGSLGNQDPTQPLFGQQPLSGGAMTSGLMPSPYKEMMTPPPMYSAPPFRY